jgi:hypothetical protein
MQTMLTIGDDVLQAAEEIAARKKGPVGPPYEIRDGIPVLVMRDPTPVTMELAKLMRAFEQLRKQAN